MRVEIVHRLVINLNKYYSFVNFSFHSHISKVTSLICHELMNNYFLLSFSIHITRFAMINLFCSPPPKKTGRYEFSQNNHYLSDDYSDDEEEHLRCK